MLQGIAGMAAGRESELDGIGIGSAGQIDFRTGKVNFAVDTLPGWTGMPIRSLVEQRFGLPVYVDNDVNVIAIAEKQFGAAKAYSHYVCLALGTGVGGAIVENGQLVRGTVGGAAELGHISVDFNGPRCSCGNYGCIEQYASGSGIARVARELVERLEHEGGSGAEAGAGGRTGTVAWQPNSHEVLAAWAREDAHAAEVMEVVIRALATAVAGIIHTLNPQAIILGGGVSEAGALLMEALEREAALRTSPSMWANCRIIRSPLGSHSGVIGAAAQVWHYGASAAAGDGAGDGAGEPAAGQVAP